MRLTSARVAWHDAFDPKLTSMSLHYDSSGAKIDHAVNFEKGLIQSVIARIREEDPAAYAWGMMAYAPLDTHIRPGRGPLYEWLEQHLKSRFKKLDLTDHDLRAQLTMLMFVAVRDAIIIDWGRPKKRREFVHLGRMIGVDAETYRKQYHRYYLFMREKSLDLAERALSPVAHFIDLWLSRRHRDVQDEIHYMIYGRTA